MPDSFSRTSSGDTTVRDPVWTRHIRSEVNRAEVKLRLVMEEREITLGEAAELKVGQVLKLQASPKTKMKLESNKQPLFWCHLGQSEGSYVVKIEDPVDLDQEFLDDILPR